MNRSPQSTAEHIIANCRPQPAIPAVIVMLIGVLMPTMTMLSGDAGSWKLWLVGAGLLGSAGLAIAAGFCSLAPQAIWLLLAMWAHSLAARAGLPVTLFWALYACVSGVVLMIFVQLWRIATQRFVPTIHSDSVDGESLDNDGGDQ